MVGFSTVSTRIHWVPRGTDTPKDKDEVNRREVCECDGCVLSRCDVRDLNRYTILTSSFTFVCFYLHQNIKGRRSRVKMLQ
jgi:hypothetical protein